MRRPTATRWRTRTRLTPSPSTPGPSGITGPADMSGPGRLIVGVLPPGLDVAEERPALDERGHGLRDHGLPGVVVRRDSPQHVPAEDGQVLRAVVVEVNEAAPPGQVIVKRLDLGLDLDVVHGLQLVIR